MNENEKYLKSNGKGKPCLTCLNTNTKLYPMSNEFTDEYTKFVDMLKEESMLICKPCCWMFKRFLRFKRQCQTAKALIEDALQTDSKSFVFTQLLTSGYNLNISQTELFSYPICFQDEIQEKPNNSVIISNDSVKISNDPVMLSNDPVRISNGPVMISNDPVRISNDPVMLSNDPVRISNGPVMISNDPVRISNGPVMLSNDPVRISNDPVMLSNDDSIDNDEEHDDLPLVLLKRNKKSKRKKNKRGSMEKDIRIESSDFNSVNGRNKKIERDGNISNGKSEKALRAGFSSRMVQETQEYLVIKLTKEQVLSEMADRAKTEEFQRFPFKCERCVKGFNFKDVLAAHLDKHSVEHGSFQCEICHQYCPSAVSLRGHIKSHTTRYKCKLCGHVRLSRQHLLEHHAIAHTTQPATYTCDTCHFNTNKRTVMQRHVRRHGRSDACACDQCGKLFRTIDSLRVHAIRHDASSRLQCGECSRTFVYASLLRRHSRSVHQRRDYYCVECDTQFKSPESLRLHFKKAVRHRDASTFNHACGECSQRMFSASALAAHRARCHAAPKAYACDVCRRAYSSKDALRAHKHRTHRQKQTHIFAGEKDQS